MRVPLSARCLTICALFGAGALAGCSPDSGDFSDHAERFINDDNAAVAEALGVTFTNAECEEPEYLVDGEGFTCVADGDDGNRYVFNAVVTGDRDYEIIEAEIETPTVEIRAED